MCLDPPSIDGSFAQDCCSSNCIGANSASCIGLATTLASGNQSQCCSTASEILSAFAEVSNKQCSTQSYVNGRPEDIAFLGSEEDILPPGTYIVPNVTFNCSGCVESVIVRGKIVEFDAKNTYAHLELQTWRKYSLPGSIHKMHQNISLSTRNITRLHSSHIVHTITFTLSENFCFESGEELGFAYSSNGQTDLAVLFDGRDNSIPAYQVEYSNDYNCMFLNDFINISTPSIATYKKPAVVLQISKHIIIIIIGSHH